MTTFTRQETFEFVATSLLEQDAKSLTPNSCPDANDICAYRGTEGRKCAAGFCIPNKSYVQEIEGFGIRSVCKITYDYDKNFVYRDFFGHDIELMEELQRVHDDYEVDTWRSTLTGVGENFDLDTSFLLRVDSKSV